jgi:hypothetical protein
MNFSDLFTLTESLTLFEQHLLFEETGPLYHATNAKAFYRIYNDNVLELSYGRVKGEKELQENYPFFASFSRIPNNYYRNRKSITIVVDGDKLKQRYRLRPVNYWKNIPDIAESEERLLSDKPEIRDFKNYITEIHVLYDEDIHASGLYDLFYGISNAWFYRDRKEYMTMRKGIPAQDFLDSVKSPQKSQNYTDKSYNEIDLMKLDDLLNWLEGGGKDRDPKIGNTRWYEYLHTYTKSFEENVYQVIHFQRNMKGVAVRKNWLRWEALLKKYKAKDVEEFCENFLKEHSNNSRYKTLSEDYIKYFYEF